jgi:hypothetical protein
MILQRKQPKSLTDKQMYISAQDSHSNSCPQISNISLHPFNSVRIATPLFIIAKLSHRFLSQRFPLGLFRRADPSI